MRDMWCELWWVITFPRKQKSRHFRTAFTYGAYNYTILLHFHHRLVR